jgi:acetolactate synthase-1/2/3 large subunit
VTLLFNNDSYGNVQQMQKANYGGRVIASDLVNPDFVRMVESFGAQAFRAETMDGLRAAIRRGFATTDGPTVIEIPIGDMPSADQFR